MLFLNRLPTGTIAFGILILSVGASLAAEPQAGLWQQTTTTTMPGMNMPQMPSLPPEALAQMQAAGVQMPNFGQPQSSTSQFCITPEDIANRQPFDDDQMDDCTQENLQMSESGMSVDILCTGETAGSGRIEYVFDSPTHYTGTMTLQSSRQGMSMNMHTDIDATWLGPDCGGVE